MSEHLARSDEPPAFSCTWSHGGHDSAWIDLTGEMDLASAPLLRRTLRELESAKRLVVLNLRELEFTDTSGVHVVVDETLRARDEGRRLVVLRGPPAVDRVFTATGSLDSVEIYDLDPAEPPIQVLLQLAASDRRRGTLADRWTRDTTFSATPPGSHGASPTH